MIKEAWQWMRDWTLAVLTTLLFMCVAGAVIGLVAFVAVKVLRSLGVLA